MVPEAESLLRVIRSLVRDAMSAERLSVDDLADGVGCSSETINRLMRGENVTMVTLARLAAGLGRRVEVRLIAEKPTNRHDQAREHVTL